MPYNYNSYHNEYVAAKMEHEFPNNFKQFCHPALKWDTDVVFGFTVGEGGEQRCPHQPYPITFQIVVIWMQSIALHRTTCMCAAIETGRVEGVSPLIKEWWTLVCSHLPEPWAKFQNFAACADDLTLSLVFTVSYHLMGRRILLKWWFNSISFTFTTRRRL